MSNTGIFAVNAATLHTSNIFLIDLERGNEELIHIWFNIHAKGEEEWYLSLNQEQIDENTDPLSIIIKKRVTELATAIYDNLYDIPSDTNEESYDTIIESIWNLTWVW